MAPSRGISRPIYSGTIFYIRLRCPRRYLSSSAHQASGHNRWSKIKHDKGKADAVKNRQSSIFAQEIATASRLFGPELSLNPRLADLVAKAKREGFAKASIEAAIARGQGRSSSGAALENVTVEGILPGNIGVIIECETDSRLKTLMDVRLAMKTAGGNTTPTAFLFRKQGRIAFERKTGVDFDQVFEIALDAGALDVEEDARNSIVVFSEPERTKSVGEQIASALDLSIATSEISWTPVLETCVGVSSDEAAEDLITFVAGLQKEPTVSAVTLNIAQGNLSENAWKELQDRISI